MAEETKTEITPPVVETPAPVVPLVDAPRYNDKQLNDILAAKVGKEASKEVAKILEAAGVKDVSEIAELVKGKKASAGDDPIKVELESLKKSQAEILARADSNEAAALALKAGVDEAKLERVVKLAMSPAYEGTITERVQKILAEVPEFVKTPGQTFGTEPKNQQADATETLLNAARKQAGLFIPESGKK